MKSDRFELEFFTYDPSMEKESSEEGIDVFESADRIWLKQAEDGTAVGGVCRKAGILETTFYKLIFDRDTRRIFGGVIVGPSAGDMIGEICLAIEMGADAMMRIARPTKRFVTVKDGKRHGTKCCMGPARFDPASATLVNTCRSQLAEFGIVMQRGIADAERLSRWG